MLTKSQTPLSVKSLTVEEIAGEINEMMPVIFRHQHLNRDLIIGFIGDRGGGKSLSAGHVATCDYMLQGEPCFTNMQVNLNIKDVGIECHSQDLDISRMLAFAPEYHGGVILIDEINIALADARRAMANQNLAADDVGQMLRKSQNALLYTCIHEMFVDSRIRDMTDIFVQTKDKALTPEGLAMRKPPGEDFLWEVFDMTGKLTGERYSDSHKTDKPTFHGKWVWGLIDSHQRQERTKVKVSDLGIEASIGVTKDPEIQRQVDTWSWIGDVAIKLMQEGRDEIFPYELWDELGLKQKGLSVSKVQSQLGKYGIRRNNMRGVYEINQFKL